VNAFAIYDLRFTRRFNIASNLPAISICGNPFISRRFFGARVFDPQHSGKSTPLELFSGFRRERLLRVTDPRSALVAASPRCAV